MEILSYYEPQLSSATEKKHTSRQRSFLHLPKMQKIKPQEIEKPISHNTNIGSLNFNFPTFAPASVSTTPLSVSDALLHEKPVVCKRRKKIDVGEIIANFENILRERVLLFLGYAFAIFLLIGVAYGAYRGMNFVNTILFENVSFENVELTDSALLNSTMKNFVLSRNAGETIDEGGNILSDSILPEITYTQPVSFSTYTVQKNDNITSITKKFGLTNVSTLIGVNNIENVRRLQAGQRLTVPSIDGLFHTITEKDTLETISEKYSISIEKLVDVNDLDSSILSAGDQLFIPGAKLDNEKLKRALGEMFTSPIAVKWRLSSPFGPRADPFTGVKSNHTGIDMVAPLKTPILASSDGKVSVVSYSSVYGNYVVITHSGGYQTLYAHLYSSCVQVGQKVSQGTKIGLLGNTGYSTGAHLHFTVYKNGKLINPFEVLK